MDGKTLADRTAGSCEERVQRDHKGEGNAMPRVINQTVGQQVLEAITQSVQPWRGLEHTVRSPALLSQIPELIGKRKVEERQ